MTLSARPFAVMTLIGVAMAGKLARASDYEIPVDSGLTLWAREDFPGITEPAVPLVLDGDPIGDYKLLQAYDHSILGTGCYPETYADIIANTFFRATYQKRDGRSASYGTSVVGTASFRPPMEDLYYIPTVLEAHLSTDSPERIEVMISATFEEYADVTSTRTFPDPPLGATANRLHVRFEASAPIALDPDLLGSDAFRLLTASSMFSSEQEYDANLLRYEDPSGMIHELALTNETPRGEHLFSTGMALGSWFKLVKEPGSTWNPGSPSVRVDVLNASGVPGGVGIQGFLAEDTSTSAESLTVWLEWLGASSTIPPETVVEVEVLVTASGDPLVQPDELGTFVEVLLDLDTDPGHVAWADLDCNGTTDGEEIQFMVNALLAP